MRFLPDEAEIILNYIREAGFMKFQKKKDAEEIVKLGKQEGLTLRKLHARGGYYVYVPGQGPWDQFKLGPIPVMEK
ncbi:hypothetical protein [Alicyclobacillus shizuokensis]|uniref:hypothetical protein n=1 Tax=Alicyclobacillus shizuokensis TaxID=392014 RepID=UPI00083452DF|nr:hypothetical protein [Alicyclobacillus shizuokensis]